MKGHDMTWHEKFNALLRRSLQHKLKTTANIEINLKIFQIKYNILASSCNILQQRNNQETKFKCCLCSNPWQMEENSWTEISHKQAALQAALCLLIFSEHPVC